MQRIGIIDLGSNTIRLAVFDVERHFGKRLEPNEFREILDEKAVAGLSAYVVGGALSQAGVQKAVDVLGKHLTSARNIDCKKVHVFATAVLRNCSNSAQVVSAIEEGTGLPIDLISGRDEAHLGFVGASIGQHMDEGLLVDIGGGSTELTRIEGGRDRDNVSLAQGSVSSYAQFVSMVLPTAEECAQIRKAFTEQLAGLRKPVAPAPQAYGIGGSVRAVSKMSAALAGRGKALKQLSPNEIDAMFDLLEREPTQFAHLAVKAVPDRLHSMVPGALILREALRAAGAETLTLCKYGVREGYLAERVLG